MKEDPPPDAKCRDKFLVQSVLVTADKEFTNVGSLVRRSGVYVPLDLRHRLIASCSGHTSSRRQSLRSKRRRSGSSFSLPTTAPPARPRQGPTVSAASQCSHLRHPRPSLPSAAYQRLLDPCPSRRTARLTARTWEKLRVRPTTLLHHRHTALLRVAASSQPSTPLPQASPTPCPPLETYKLSSMKPRRKSRA
jgi:hypothetical protein